VSLANYIQYKKVFFILLFVCLNTNAQVPNVISIERPDTVLQNFFDQTFLMPYDYDDQPKMSQVLSDITALVKGMIINEDGKNDIKVFIFDHASPNALVFEEKGTKYVGVSSGLIAFSKSDDEIAFVLGHELEHKISQIAEKRKEILKKYSHDFFAIMVSDQWSKVEESEVDFKSIFRRLKLVGMNPQGARDFLLRISEKYGDHPSRSHPMNSSRGSFLDIGLTGATRGLGQQINDGERTTTVVDKAQAVLRAPKNRQRKLQKIAEIMASDLDEVRHVLEEIKIDSLSDENSYLENLLLKLTHKKVTKIDALAGDIMRPEEVLKLKTQVISDATKRLKN